MVVIIGGGIAGVSTAYYLSSLVATGSSSIPLPITLVDAAVVGASTTCASGKAGAFVTSSWGMERGSGGTNNQKQKALFRESFALHEALADELELKSFQTVSAFRVADQDDNDTMSPLAGPSAMVDPAELTTKLFQKTLQQEGTDVTFQQGFVEGLETENNSEDGRPRVTSIRFQDGATVASLDVGSDEEVVIALGPWSSRIEDWLDVPLPLDGVVSTSLIWNDIMEDDSSFSDKNKKALFCSEDDQGCHLEIFPRTSTNDKHPTKSRSSSSIYVSGCGGSEVWSPAVFRSPEESPDPTRDCLPNRSRATAAQTSLQSLADRLLVPPEVTTRSPDVIQACIRPTTPDGMPIMGKLPGYQNVYVCSGGGPWGITWGPLLGSCLAKCILYDRAVKEKEEDWEEEDLDLPIRISPLRPSRFDTLLYRSLRQQRKSSSSR
jgi:glycine/D-amino acid oxidase-like deaminating enzyme